MPRPQFTLRALLLAMLVVGAFFGGAHFGAKRERERLASERAEMKKEQEQMRHHSNELRRAWTAERDLIRDLSERERMVNERERRFAEKGS